MLTFSSSTERWSCLYLLLFSPPWSLRSESADRFLFLSGDISGVASLSSSLGFHTVSLISLLHNSQAPLAWMKCSLCKRKLCSCSCKELDLLVADLKFVGTGHICYRTRIQIGIRCVCIVGFLEDTKLQYVKR